MWVSASFLWLHGNDPLPGQFRRATVSTFEKISKHEFQPFSSQNRGMSMRASLDFGVVQHGLY